MASASADSRISSAHFAQTNALYEVVLARDIELTMLERLCVVSADWSAPMKSTRFRMNRFCRSILCLTVGVLLVFSGFQFEEFSCQVPGSCSKLNFQIQTSSVTVLIPDFRLRKTHTFPLKS